MSEVTSVVDQRILEDILSAHDRVVVKFTAPAWCAPCRAFKPVFEEAAKRDETGAKFVSVDIDNAQWAPVEYGFQGVPTVVLFENGERVRDLKERKPVKFMSELA